MWRFPYPAHDTMPKTMKTVTISHTTKTYPKHSYQTVKDDILGKTYELSLVFIGSTRAQQLNISTRGKDYIPNVLSFPYDQKAGEIFICPTAAKREASKFDLTYNQYVLYLFIHGLLHLKGLDHGDKMDKAEIKYLKRYT